ncbi:Outer membrane chaperone Skp (OmpH) [uncultured Paludibacter sp.]|nr:Outer membrane chaperone Skp (OmpH) [uncultured Paludibacter sp.]
MKNLSLIFNAILLIAVLILFFLVLGKKNQGVDNALVKKGDSTAVINLPVAYVNIDSLLLNYTFAKQANEALTKKQEDSRLTINSRQRELQGEMINFQKKLENNAFLSRERAEQEQLRIQKKQQDLQATADRLSQQIMEQQQKMSEQLRDTIDAFMKEYNKDGKYQLILSNTANDNILYAGEKYDITADVIKKLNDRYKK